MLLLVASLDRESWDNDEDDNDDDVKDLTEIFDESDQLLSLLLIVTFSCLSNYKQEDSHLNFLSQKIKIDINI